MTQPASEFEALRSRLELSPSGSLTLNGQPMILLPRHFFRYLLREVKALAGPQPFESIFRKAGHDGAVTFCRRFREFHGCTPQEAVEGYLKEMSLRGWGQFSLLRLEPETGYLEAILQNSALEPEGDLPSGDLIWEGAMLGTMTFLQESMGSTLRGTVRVRSEEIPGAHHGTPTRRIVVTRESEGSTTP